MKKYLLIFLIFIPFVTYGATAIDVICSNIPEVLKAKEYNYVEFDNLQNIAFTLNSKEVFGDINGIFGSINSTNYCFYKWRIIYPDIDLSTNLRDELYLQRTGQVIYNQMPAYKYVKLQYQDNGNWIDYAGYEYTLVHFLIERKKYLDNQYKISKTENENEEQSKIDKIKWDAEQAEYKKLSEIEFKKLQEKIKSEQNKQIDKKTKSKKQRKHYFKFL